VRGPSPSGPPPRAARLEDDQVPTRRVVRPKRHTAACLRRQADLKKRRLCGGAAMVPAAPALAAIGREAPAAALAGETPAPAAGLQAAAAAAAKTIRAPEDPGDDAALEEAPQPQHAASSRSAAAAADAGTHWPVAMRRGSRTLGETVPGRRRRGPTWRSRAGSAASRALQERVTRPSRIAARCAGTRRA
jgi:hypothetical protein